jgi:hypothetical protein
VVYVVGERGVGLGWVGFRACGWIALERGIVGKAGFFGC